LKHSRFQRTRWAAYIYIFILLPIVLSLSPARGCSPAASASSHIKKPLIYQFGNVVHINADGERPLLRALDALQEKYGWIVDYEDPTYAADTTTNAPDLPSRRHAMERDFMRQGFSVEFTVGPTPESPPDENAVLTTVVNASNESNAVAQFELRSESDRLSDNENAKPQERRFEVVGISGGEGSGPTQGPQPILSLPITLAKEPRSARRTIALICEQVSERSKIPVSVGTIDGNVAGRKQVAVGGTDVPARALLTGTVASMGDRVSWRMLYDASGRNYVLNLSGLSR
jgi:hypothetical protein